MVESKVVKGSFITYDLSSWNKKVHCKKSHFINLIKLNHWNFIKCANYDISILINKVKIHKNINKNLAPSIMY